MAFDTAMHFLDELKDKYLQEVEKAIEDWDYQDFSPDKRTPLLDNEVINDVADDLQPEINALQQIKDTQSLDWAPLGRDAMLADQTFGPTTASTSFEARVVAMASPPGGVQGIPDTDAAQRLLQHALTLNPTLVAEALCSRLQLPTWQIRSKALVVTELLLESPDLVHPYLAAFLSNAQLIQVIDRVRTADHNPIARENARKVLSLIRSNGTNSSLVAREPVAPKPHVRHVPADKTKTTVVEKPTLKVDTAVKKPLKQVSPVKKSSASPPAQPQPQHAYQGSSPKIAAAALASWRRRSQKELQANASQSPRHSSIHMKAPAPVSPAIRTSSLHKSGSSRSAFTFMDHHQHQPQQRGSITASSRTHSFH